MATVSSQLTRIHDVEGALTLTSIGGGAGGAANAEIVIQGAQSAGRKQSNATDHGFFLTVGSQNVSGAGVHVGAWVNHVHYGVLTKLAARLGSATTAYHEHAFPLSTYPPVGGWVRFWIDVGRTPEATAGTFDKAALTQIGVLASLPAVSGNAPNLILDASDFTTGGLLLTGTAGVWQDFVTADESNGTNKYGVVTTNSGVIFCQARLTLGSASSLVFNDSSFVIVFPNQSTVASNFMGISVDLQNASTNVDWSNGVVKSAGAVKGDLVVTGTAGLFDVLSTTLASLRVITLTSGCTLDGCLISGCGQITLSGATLTNCTVSNSTAATAVLAATPAGATLVSGCDFTSAGTGHGLEITGTAANFTLTNDIWTGYAGSDGSTGNEAVYVNIATGSLNLTVSGGSTPSVRTAGCTVTVVTAARTVKVAVTSVSGAVTGANVFLAATAGGSFPSNATVTSITRSGTTATVTHETAHGMATNDQVNIDGITDKIEDNNGVHTITVTGSNTYTYTTTDSGSTNYTGTIKSTFVFLKGLATAGTNSNEISMTRTIPSDQPVVGWARKSTSAPYYKEGAISGTVSSAGDTTFSPVLISDD